MNKRKTGIGLLIAGGVTAIGLGTGASGILKAHADSARQAAPIAAVVSPPAATALAAGAPSQVTVVGHGSAVAPPDTANVSLGVNVHAASVASALNGASALQAKLIAAIKNAGVPAADIATDSISVDPHWTNGANDGYDGSQSANVTIRDLSKISAVITAAANVAGNQASLGGITFTRQETTSLLPGIRAAAMASALSSANGWATLNHCSVGAVRTVSEVVGTPPPATVVAGSGGQGGAGGGVPVEVGTQFLTVDVEVTYAMTC